MDPLIEVVPRILTALHYLTLLICLLCFKWRYLADYLYPLLTGMLFFTAFNLSERIHDSDAVDIGYLWLILYLTISNAWLTDAILCTVSYGVNIFIGINVAYERPLTLQKVVFLFCLTVLCFFLSIFMNMLVILVARLNERRQLANKSHISMLDSMHEGLLVLEKSATNTPPQFLFCNKTAQKLINRSLGSIEDCHDPQKAEEAQKQIMTK